MHIIECRDVGRHYGSGAGMVKALDAVHLDIEPGSFVSVVGESGCGKSTLLHVLGGIDRPDTGTVRIDGEDLYSRKEASLALIRRRKIGFVFQFFNLLPVLTAEENIILPLLMDRKPVDRLYLDELLVLLGLQDRRGHLPSQLSGGQQQRVSLGRALIYRPSIILADEPTGNLDSRSSRDVMDLLKLSARRYRQTLLMVTHNRELACEADRVITMADGKVVRDRVNR